MGPRKLVDDVVEQLSLPQVVETSRHDQPGYWRDDPMTLLAKANFQGVAFGTGLQVYANMILPAIEQAQHEVILVTCFWARSSTLDDLNTTLQTLSARAVQDGRQIRVRICFSSSSLWQKLLQTSSVDGRHWSSTRWRQDLGLPSEAEVPGLDLRVKSIFQLPFSVMHPKFVIIDRQTILLPSCNVSWEVWFEGCLSMDGPVVRQFVRFWLEFWADSDDRVDVTDGDTQVSQQCKLVSSASKGLLSSAELNAASVDTLFLPSPHHRFSVPWLTSDRPPPTPLNIYLLTLISRAEREVHVQTPNLTFGPCIEALLAACKRGVQVTVFTSRRLMVLEQIVTAGTTTARCVQNLVKQHKRLLSTAKDVSHEDLEAGLMRTGPGRLVVKYYEPRGDGGLNEPQQSHVKLTIVDGSIAVFGSGNMDRASWHTSQELGLALTSKDVVGTVTRCLNEAMDGRTIVHYDSTAVVDTWS
ncbi:hypothetical protein LTR78_001393 [Recurvomyces mirabilis]|uniref:PLD phosphodiesterase domain-containing protein n=1 Tax=Recurvomyces mirabilis TaxID=574656 RepID=A0AAE0WW21_9PEZI|nr:hypothetical protein LTR78_001393 [Recurvomyces mirabilis]KAK5161370.1 hypothetical protein LTS14_001166 [Recurvomyces mirabilis]